MTGHEMSRTICQFRAAIMFFSVVRLHVNISATSALYGLVYFQFIYYLETNTFFFILFVSGISGVCFLWMQPCWIRMNWLHCWFDSYPERLSQVVSFLELLFEQPGWAAAAHALRPAVKWAGTMETSFHRMYLAVAVCTSHHLTSRHLCMSAFQRSSSVRRLQEHHQIAVNAVKAVM